MGQELELELELELRELRSLLQVFVVDRYIAIALKGGNGPTRSAINQTPSGLPLEKRGKASRASLAPTVAWRVRRNQPPSAGSDRGRPA